MRYFVSMLLVLALLFAGTALAEPDPGERVPVDYCNEYITLREYPNTSAPALARVPLGGMVLYNGPAENGFSEVSWMCKTGYVLTQYLNFNRANEDRTDNYMGTEVTLSSQERYNVNLFLSNFAEQCGYWTRGYIDEQATDEALVDFAIDHIWFNQNNKMEWGEWGYDNVRLADKYISAVTQKYLGRKPKNLSKSRYDHRNGYYYWQETGGHMDDGFAILQSVERLDNGRCLVRFSVVNPDQEWKNDVCYCTLSEALNRFEYARVTYTGTAVINTGSGSLSYRSNWRLERWGIRYIEY